MALLSSPLSTGGKITIHDAKLFYVSFLSDLYLSALSLVAVIFFFVDFGAGICIVEDIVYILNNVFFFVSTRD